MLSNSPPEKSGYLTLEETRRVAFITLKSKTIGCNFIDCTNRASMTLSLGVALQQMLERCHNSREIELLVIFQNKIDIKAQDLWEKAAVDHTIVLTFQQMYSSPLDTTEL